MLVAFISCDDSLKDLGFTIQPEKDRITVSADSLFLRATTVDVESLLPEGMFSKTKNPVLGQYIDSLFGTIKSDYVGQFYYPEGNNFPEDNVIIDSVKVAVFYNSWIGDPLAPVKLSVYEINKDLPVSSHYTNFDPAKYVDMTSGPIGESNFTAANIEVPREEREQPNYYHRAFVDLPKSIGERIHYLSETIEDLDTDSFQEYFKGLYMTTDLTGSIVTVDYTYLYIYYNYLDKNGSSTKEDTIRPGNLRLNTTPEVIQINRIKNNNDKLLEENDEYAFIKSPAGVFTEIKIPLSEKADKIKNQALNQAKLKITALPQKDSEHKFKLSPSPYMLLINKDDMKEFFEKRRVPNNVTSFYAQLDQTTYTYNFGNLSAMINHYKKENDGEIEDLTYLLVPIDLGMSDIQGQQQQVTGIYNQMTPTATTIFKSPNKLKMELIFSKL